MQILLSVIFGALLGGGVQIGVNLVLREIRRRRTIEVLVGDAKRQKDVAEKVRAWAEEFGRKHPFRVPQYVPALDTSQWQSALKNPEDLPCSIFRSALDLYSLLQSLNHDLSDFTKEQRWYIDLFYKNGVPHDQEVITRALDGLAKAIQAKAEEVPHLVDAFLEVAIPKQGKPLVQPEHEE